MLSTDGRLVCTREVGNRLSENAWSADEAAAADMSASL
jgi:hypothetical protein